MQQRDGGMQPILGSLSPLVVSHYSHTWADHYGARTAQQELMLAALSEGAAAELHVLSPAEPGGPGAAGETVIPGLPPPLAVKMRWRGLASLDREQLPDEMVFLGSAPELPKLSALRRALGGRFPVCAIVHSVFFTELLGCYLNILVLAEAADALVVTSTAARKAVESLIEQAGEILRDSCTGAGSRPDASPRIEQIPLGVPDSLTKLLPQAAARALLNLPESARVVLYVGRLSEAYKADLEPLLRVFAEASQKCPEALLLIAGQEDGGKYSRALEELARALGIAAKVRFVVSFPRFAKAVLYSAADIFVSPVDNIQESFGISVLEAMAAGLAVIVSDWSGYRDLVTEGETGFLAPTCASDSALHRVSVLAAACPTPVPEQYVAARTVVDTRVLHERLAALLSSRELCQRLGSAARARVQRDYVWSVVIRRFAGLWREQIRAAGHSQPRRAAGLDYAALLQGYPSGPLHLESLAVECSQATLACASGHYGADDPKLELLRLCRARSRPVMELIGPANPSQKKDADEIVIRLLKKGLLRIAAE